MTLCGHRRSDDMLMDVIERVNILLDVDLRHGVEFEVSIVLDSGAPGSPCAGRATDSR